MFMSSSHGTLTTGVISLSHNSLQNPDCSPVLLCTSTTRNIEVLDQNWDDSFELDGLCVFYDILQELLKKNKNPMMVIVLLIIMHANS